MIKAANALTRLSNTYQIPIHKLSGEDDSALPLELGEITRIAQHYKEKARPRVRNFAYTGIIFEKSLGKIGIIRDFEPETDGSIVLCGIILLSP